MYYSLLLIAFCLSVWGIVTLNALIRARASVDESRSEIALLLKRRFDLIPGAATVLKTHINDEALEGLLQVRNAAVYTSPLDIAAQAQASAAMSDALRKVMDLAVPDSDAQEKNNVKESLAALEKVEVNLQTGCKVYNNAVGKYNLLCESFPSNLIAHLFHFTKKNLFTVTSLQ
ncbi:LemA family protein [Runella slithyformis]|nr:LemA family protein [Runella slithyformis]